MLPWRSCYYYIIWLRETPKFSITQSGLQPVWFNIIFHSIIWIAQFRKKFIERNKCVCFLYKTVREFFILKGFIETWSETTYRSSYTVLNICHNLMNLEFSRQTFKIISNIKLHEFPSSGIRFIPKELQEITATIRAIRQMNRLKRTYFPVHWTASWVSLRWEIKDAAI